MNFQHLDKGERHLLAAIIEDMESSLHLSPGMTLREYRAQLANRATRDIHGFDRGQPRSIDSILALQNLNER